MGKSKQAKERKFDRNVEISAPILDPEIIKAIHTPPKGQRLDIKHGGFKALLSDLNSQDSTDSELIPLNDNHVPSYIGISCAVSGYSNYSSYSKKPTPAAAAASTTKTAINNNYSGSTPNRSRATSPVLNPTGPEVHHITVDRSLIQSVDEERKELTEKLTASATERRRSPSPCIPPTEDDRHHGAYVGARYCPLPAPSKIVNKHIPLLGIDDDDENRDEQPEEENKVEQRIASLYGGDFVEDWRESMTHKAKKELTSDQTQITNKNLMNPKDLVTLRPTPIQTSPDKTSSMETNQTPEMPVPNVKVLANVERQFLNKLLTDENPPVPTALSSSKLDATTTTTTTKRDDIKGLVGSDDKVAQGGEENGKFPSSAIAADFVSKTEDYSPTPATIVGPNADLKAESMEIPVDINRDVKIINELEANSTAQAELIAPFESTILNNTTKTNDDNMRIKSADANTSATAEDDNSNLELIGSELASTKNLIDIIDTEPAEVALSEATMRDDHNNDDDDINLTEAAPQSLVVGQNVVDIGQDGAFDETKPIDSGESQQHSIDKVDLIVPVSQSKEEHIEYEIRAQSPVDNESSPIKEVTKARQPEADCCLAGFEEDLEKFTQKEDSITGGGGENEEKLATGDSKDGRFYLGLLDKEKSFILEQITKAEAILELEDNSEFDEDKIGKFRSAIGKANLLINKKFNQFKELCEANINRKGDEQFATLNDDLAGFWDMLSIQVGDVQKSFENLWKQENVVDNMTIQADENNEGSLRGGIRESPSRERQTGKRKLSAQKDQERRERLQEHINQMKKKDQAAKMSNENLLEE